MEDLGLKLLLTFLTIFIANQIIWECEKGSAAKHVRSIDKIIDTITTWVCNVSFFGFFGSIILIVWGV